MKYCEKCKVNVTGKRVKCPLCGYSLKTIDENDEEYFPDTDSKYYKYNFYVKIALLISVIIGVFSVMIEELLQGDVQRGFFVIAALVCIWMNFIMIMIKKSNIHKVLLWQALIIFIISIAWDALTGWNRWSVNFVLPISCCIFIGIMTILAIILRPKAGDYVIYIVIDSVLGVLQTVLILKGIVTIIYPSIFCIGINVIVLAALIIFKGREVMDELYKRLHI